MSYPVPSFAQIRNVYLTALQNHNPDFDIAPDSDHFVRASAIASVVEGLFAYVGWTFRQIFADTADPENVVHHAAIKSLHAKPAAFAFGSALVSGAVGRVLPVGSQIVCEGGVVVATVGGSVTFGRASEVVSVVAVNAGVGGNVSNERGCLSPAVAGFSSEVANITLSGGADEESVASLLARYLELLRNQPAGGKAADLRRWALEVPGVASARVVSRLRGLGTVDVFVSTASGLPSAQLLADVLAHLRVMSPVGIKDIAVRAPVYLTVDVALAVKGVGDFETVLRPQCVALTQAYFATFEAGESFVLSKFEALISAQSNISDRKVLSPSANVELGVDADRGDTALEWLRLGSVTVSRLGG